MWYDIKYPYRRTVSEMYNEFSNELKSASHK